MMNDETGAIMMKSSALWGPTVARKKRDYERIVLFVFAAQNCFPMRHFICDAIVRHQRTHTRR